MSKCILKVMSLLTKIKYETENGQIDVSTMCMYNV